MAKVLIIEDDHSIRLNITEILTIEGHKVFEATDGEFGIDIAFKELPDIILCDINMPIRNGFDVLTSLKTNEMTQDIPIFFITAIVEEETRLKGIKLGVTGFIRKPFQLNKIVDIINLNT